MTDFSIGFDAKRAFCNFTGLGNYSRSILAGLREASPDQRIVLFTPRAVRRAETDFLFDGSYEIVTPRNQPLWRSVFIRDAIERSGIDLYHGLSHELPLFAKPRGVRYVVTVHDLIYAFFPHDFSIIDKNIYALKTRSACRKSERIIAVSQSTKNDVVNRYGIDPGRITVVYQPCHDRFTTRVPAALCAAAARKYGLPPSYLLYVGSIIERKNLLTLVKAIELLQESSTPPLAVVGEGSHYKERVLRHVASQNLAKRVLFLPGVDAADLPAIYQGATILVYPSRYEGFGLPIVEALQSGIPVITSPCSSLPEAAGPGALYADPDIPEDLAEKIKTLLNDGALRKKLVSEGADHIRKFNAAAAAGALLDAYRETLS
jgi:glycosyltransferase involved in cell wall biosynthesis